MLLRKSTQRNMDEKDKTEEEGDVVEKLNFAMCGTRDAASSWEACYTEVMTQAGFQQRQFTPCVFRKGEVVVTIHGDDFTMTGPEEGLEEVERIIRARFEVKV